ncbi:MAG: MobF family relaxase [Nocardioides sp.]|uniref:MobF family relaxase n=1 Tax=Nocardioides sp. TaxID=35761 RepID=UPI0032638D18
MHGGVKFYRGSASAARNYVEADRSRADDYYLAEGTGLATRYVATTDGVQQARELDGATYEQWVAGYDVANGLPKGRLRRDDNALRFVEVVVNGPKTWSLAASLHPEIGVAYDAAQDRAAAEIIGWLAEHATTRIGPRGRQVQVPVEQIEAAVVRHYTSRAGDPHRHLHVQINARVFAAGAWRGLHSVGVVDSINAINGIGHAAVMCDPEFRQALAAHGYTLDADSGEVTQLAPYAAAFSARTAQIARNTDRYEAEWRRDNPGAEPGPGRWRSWDRRAWADARPDKVIPRSGADLAKRWHDELHDLGFVAPSTSLEITGTPIGRLNREAVVTLALTRLGAQRSAWNAADIRGEVERIVADVDIVAAGSARRELAEDLTARAVTRCALLLDRDDVPAHVRSLTSQHVLDVEEELTDWLILRAEASPAGSPRTVSGTGLDEGQRLVVQTLAGSASLVVVEGAAGVGKTTTLAAVRTALDAQERRLVIVTPTLQAARVAEQQVGTDAHSAGWLIHQHGFRWDDDGHWSRVLSQPDLRARLLPGDLLLVDEAGMLDQDTARALLTIADETGARLALAGDRHQLPAVGRGGVLDLAARWTPPEAHLTLDTVHRFADAEYADLSLLMRTGERSGEVFDALVRRGEIVIHASEVERRAVLAEVEGLVIADTREQVTCLNAAIRDRRRGLGESPRERAGELVTSHGECIGVGDRIYTRRNERDLDVANRDTWTVLAAGSDGSLRVKSDRGERVLPPAYVRAHVELAYATTVHGAQGQTVDTAHLAVGDATGAAAAYVGMTRGRRSNVAHLVAESVDEAREQWVRTFSRDRADLGPGHAADLAAEDIDRYGPRAPRRPVALQAAMLGGGVRRPPEPIPSAPTTGRGISR